MYGAILFLYARLLYTYTMNCPLLMVAVKLSLTTESRGWLCFDVSLQVTGRKYLKKHTFMQLSAGRASESGFLNIYSQHCGQSVVSLHIHFLSRFGILFRPNIVQSLRPYLAQIISFVDGTIFARIKFQIVEKIWTCAPYHLVLNVQRSALVSPFLCEYLMENTFTPSFQFNPFFQIFDYLWQEKGKFIGVL